MRIPFLYALAAAALVLMPVSVRAENRPNVSDLRPKPTYAVIDQLIAQRSLLALDSSQLAQLSKLREHLRTDRGRLKNIGRRGPRSVARYVRVFPTSKEALRLAFELLTPEQRTVASRLLQAKEHPEHHADTNQANGVRG